MAIHLDALRMAIKGRNSWGVERWAAPFVLAGRFGRP
jgi:hypothetical protein